jgi:shikimate dehydrogenase
MHKIAGVFGWPVNHSLSPKLHGYWLKHYGIDGEYTAQAVEPDNLAAALKSLPKKNWRGCNLTLPHKETAVEILDSLDEVAESIGAVNTVVVGADGALRGTNTDAYGFFENIRSSLPKQKRKAVVLGAGGAAKAVCYALIQTGFSEIVVANRTQDKSTSLVAQFKGNITVGNWENRSVLLECADLLVNTTSLGMKGKDALDIDLAKLPTSALVTDIVYVPLLTPLLEKAKARGNPIVDGLGMLLHQAVPGFEAWFGVRPEVTGKLREYMLAV